MDAALALEFQREIRHIKDIATIRMPAMIPARLSRAVFCLIMSGLMSCIVTGIATVKAIGFGPSTLGDWMASWAFCWPIAFTVILLFGPVVQRFVNRLVRPQD